MKRARRSRTAGWSAGVAALSLLTAQPAASQTAQTPDRDGNRAAATWEAAAGRDGISLRDIARSTRPVDASPVEWTGHGPTVSVSHRRFTRRRLHVFEAQLSTLGGFEYVTPLASIARSRDESASRISGRYEYRRYLFTDVLVHGLDVGLGALGGADRLAWRREFQPSTSTRDTRTMGILAGVTAVRFRPITRAGLELSWSNGAMIGRSRQTHTALADPAMVTWGGGWLTELALAGDVRLTPAASLVVSYVRSGTGMFASHNAVAASRRQLTAGVRYGR